MLHIPEGVRDIYNGECLQKHRLEREIHQVFYRYGFEAIETPSFEFFDVFNKERGTIPSREMYKFFDREGNTLVLRPDMTPAIARCFAKYFKEELLPVRLCYSGNTYINNESHKGKLNETTQLGAELMNDGSVEADAEMLALTIEALRAAGLTQFQVEIGHADFLNGLMQEADLTAEEKMEVKELFEGKNIFGIESFLEKKQLSAELTELFLELPELFGTLEQILKAERLVKNERSLTALNRLKQLHELLGAYGLNEYITFDLGMLSRYDYYTGIILKAYTYGTGEPVAKGGRYDTLVGQFGKDAPAIGVAILADQISIALARQKLSAEPEKDTTVLLYQEGKGLEAAAKAGELRRQGERVMLAGCREGQKDELRQSYQQNPRVKQILFL